MTTKRLLQWHGRAGCELGAIYMHSDQILEAAGLRVPNVEEIADWIVADLAADHDEASDTSGTLGYLDAITRADLEAVLVVLARRVGGLGSVSHAA